jgi:hypothetical protein
MQCIKKIMQEADGCTERTTEGRHQEDATIARKKLNKN